MDTVDIVVIGSGVGGLCCSALLAHYGFDVVVCEGHAIAGGAAHAFTRSGYHFDSGPSLHSGLSYSPSSNPLRQVLDALDVDLPCVTYDRWGCCLPDGDFDTAVGANQFCDVLSRLQGPTAVAEWRSLQTAMAPLKDAAIAIPPAALRFDWGAFQTVSRYAPSMLRHVFSLPRLTGPFSNVIEQVITDPFIYRWLDLLCFLLSGLPATGTSTAEMAFMFAEWYRPDVVLDYPRGGSGALVDALVTGLETHGGALMLNAHVEKIVMDGDRATGIQLRNGKTIHARKAVISNASIWDTLPLLPDGHATRKLYRQRQAIAPCDSFMHLHLGIDATGLSPDLACHHIVVNDWAQVISAPQNVVLISIPSILDQNLAPSGKHTIHVYTPGNEPYTLWDGLDRNSKAYQHMKTERADVMWLALERVIPDVRDRCELTLVGTPLTHERFLRRHRGSYGPAIQAGNGLFPGPLTPVTNLLCCGDSTFPGIGLPAVAASGMIAANTLAPISKHLAMLDKISGMT
ncbi:MAG: NAD(P)/FAD-dependent oxidoreductase [Cyanobacteria bacterium P01_E01_bin.6]